MIFLTVLNHMCDGQTDGQTGRQKDIMGIP